MSTTPNLQELNTELDQMILSGKAIDAFEKFYADDVEMQENSEPPTKGKDANRKREEDFFSSVEQFHGAEVLSSAAGDDVSFSEWLMDVTFKGGRRTKLRAGGPPPLERWQSRPRALLLQQGLNCTANTGASAPSGSCEKIGKKLGTVPAPAVAAADFKGIRQARVDCPPIFSQPLRGAGASEQPRR